MSVSGLQEGDKVLDVCTGTGDLAIEYAKAAALRPRHSEAEPKNLVVGTDFCDEMLRLATLKASTRGQGFFTSPVRIDLSYGARANLVTGKLLTWLATKKSRVWSRKSRAKSQDSPPLLSPPSQGGDRGGVELKPQNLKLRFVEADTLHLPFTDGSFQVSSVAFGIRNVADLGTGIREMTRVISPGGRVVILEFAEPENRVFRRVYDFYFHKILPVIGRLISTSEIDAYAYLPGSVETFPNRWQLKAMMESCGLEDVKIYPRTFGIVNIFVGKKPDSKQSKPCENEA